MKTVIVYHSYHHGNTKKLVDAIAAKHEVTLVDAATEKNCDLFKEKDTDFLGSYRATGLITWGPFAIGGGSKKGHPTQEEIDGAVRFYEGLVRES